LIYAVSPLTGVSVGELNSGLHVYDSGVELYCEGRTADVETAAPSPGCYLASDNGYIVLGSTPAGTVTCSAAGHGMALVSSPANLITQVLTLAGKSSLINAASFATHAAADRHEAGLYLADKTNLSTIIDQLLAPCSYWYFNHSGELLLGQMTDPAGLTSVYTADSQTNVKSWNQRKSLDTKGGVPASKVTLKYAHNYTVQTRRAWLAEEWRTSAADTAAVIHPASEELLLDTARTELLPTVTGLYTIPRQLIDIEIIPSAFLAASVILPGQCVTLNLHGRFGFSGDKTIVVGILIDYIRETVRLTLWS
jgi:hypothetical protein